MNTSPHLGTDRLPPDATPLDPLAQLAVQLSNAPQDEPSLQYHCQCLRDHLNATLTCVVRNDGILKILATSESTPHDKLTRNIPNKTSICRFIQREGRTNIVVIDPTTSSLPNLDYSNPKDSTYLAPLPKSARFGASCALVLKPKTPDPWLFHVALATQIFDESLCSALQNRQIQRLDKKNNALVSILQLVHSQLPALSLLFNVSCNVADLFSARACHAYMLAGSQRKLTRIHSTEPTPTDTDDEWLLQAVDRRNAQIFNLGPRNLLNRSRAAIPVKLLALVDRTVALLEVVDKRDIFNMPCNFDDADQCLFDTLIKVVCGAHATFDFISKLNAHPETEAGVAADSRVHRQITEHIRNLSVLSDQLEKIDEEPRGTAG